MGALQKLDFDSAIFVRRFPPQFQSVQQADRSAAPNGWRRHVIKPDVESLMEAIGVRRDSQAFAELFSLFAPRIKAFMIKGGADPSAAEELAQETMVQVWRRAASFDPAKASASTWIFTIARNKRIDRLRREGRPTPDPVLYEADLPTPASPLETVESVQMEWTLRSRIAKLSSDQIEVIEKAFYEDKSHAAIAQDLGLPLGTVKSRIRLALGRLRAMMDENKEMEAGS